MRLLAIAMAALTLAGCAGADYGTPGALRLQDQPLAANPSAFIAAELAFARLAQEKGQWTAFRDTAARDAVMFVPTRVRAQEWLRGRADPPVSVRWQPHRLVTSCDGSAGATTGAAQWPDGSHGYFTTVWTRGPDGTIRWVLDHGAPVATPRPAPDFIAADSASCSGRAGVALTAGNSGDDVQIALSRDQTLSWESAVRPDGARTITIRMWTGAEMATVIQDDVPAPGASAP